MARRAFAALRKTCKIQRSRACSANCPLNEAAFAPNCNGWSEPLAKMPKPAAAFRGHFTAEHHHGVEIPGIYWHFVDVMWIVVYTTIYIL